MKQCPQPDCSWQAITASAAGARNAYLKHVVDEHAGADDEIAVDWFEKSPGQTSDRRSHEHEQVFIVLDGELVLHTEDTSFELSTGDSMPIEAGVSYHSENPSERTCVGIRTSARGYDYESVHGD